MRCGEGVLEEEEVLVTKLMSDINAAHKIVARTTGNSQDFNGFGGLQTQ